jgi:2',3'-cyclic-nucleotide 2'-phosphodiesterase (5'-nucleotidase family)
LTDAGKVTLGDLMSVLPFVNNMVQMSLKGSDLLEVLEWSVDDYNANERKGKFLQYSGKPRVYAQHIFHPLTGHLQLV